MAFEDLLEKNKAARQVLNSDMRNGQNAEDHKRSSTYKNFPKKEGKHEHDWTKTGDTMRSCATCGLKQENYTGY